MKRTRPLLAPAVLCLASFTSVARSADAPAPPWLADAAREAEGIDDPVTRAVAWWRIAAISAEVGDDALCEKVVERAKKQTPAGNAAGLMFAEAFAARFVILAKVAAGKVQEAEALVPPAPVGPREDTPSATARLAWVQGLARRGDVARAIEVAQASPRQSPIPYGFIAEEQAKRGDKAGAVETAKLILKGGTNPELCQNVAVTLVRCAGADEEARAAARLYEPYQDVALAEVAIAQVDCGRYPEAEKTLALVREEWRKDPAKEVMAAALVRRGDVEGGKRLATSMTWPGSFGTNEKLVGAAIDSGNWDAARALARDVSSKGDRRLIDKVERARADGRGGALARMRAKALVAPPPSRRFGALSEVGRASVAAGKGEALRAWRDGLESPADRVAVSVGAAMGGAGLRNEDVLQPELMTGTLR
jgi:hypothetical protein